MATDFILFVHGVNTRDERETPQFADSLIQGLKNELGHRLPRRKTTGPAVTVGQDRTRNTVYIPLYWGDVNIKAENRLRRQLQASPLWNDMWFRDFREKQLLQFAGDAALYISRHIGYKVVNRLKTDAIARIQNYQPGDCLHLVTHSWGTVILFDVLFAGRWNDPDVPGHKDVMAIRDAIFGLSGDNDDASQGMPLASLHTMGSPVAIFSLTNVSSDVDDSGEIASAVPSTHDITPRLKQLLESLYKARGNKKLPWRNYIHPGDPIAFPLEELMSSLVDRDKLFIDFHDLLTREFRLSDIIFQPLSQTFIALLQGGDAHGSYWHSDQVVKEIASFLKPAVAREVVSSK